MTAFRNALLAIVAILAGVVVFQHQSLVKESQGTEAWREQAEQIPALQAENERLSNQLAQAGSSSVEPEQVHELARLRAEVAQLRGQAAEAAAAKLRAQQSENEIAALRAQNNDLQKTETENQELQSRAQANQAVNQAAQAQNACINNLRLIDSAKQQWALESKKLPTDIPTADDLRPYLGKGPNGDFPTCPSGGAYTIGAVGEAPRCSVIGHVLP